MTSKSHGSQKLGCIGLVGVLLSFLIGGNCFATEPIKLGLLKVIGGTPVFVALEKGYFAAKGLDVQLTYFNAGEPIAVAVTSGDVDIGYTGISAGFYGLASGGALKIIAGSYREVPGFRIIGYLASNRAYANGLKSLSNLPGHAVAVTQVGAFDYALGRLADKYGFDVRSIRIEPLQSIPNVASAIKGGQVDAGMTTAGVAIPMTERGDAKLLGWVGDETPLQQGIIIARTSSAKNRRDVLERFLQAYRESARECHDAFVGPGEQRRDGPSAAEIIAIAVKYLGLTPEQVSLGMAYIDADGRLDTDDISRQIEWYKAHGMLKAPITATQIIESSYVRRLQDQ